MSRVAMLDVLMLRKIENLQSSVPEQTRSFSNAIMKWWKSLNRSVAYKLLHMAQHSNEKDRMKALYNLNAMKHLKGDIFHSLLSNSLLVTLTISMANYRLALSAYRADVGRKKCGISCKNAKH